MTLLDELIKRIVDLDIQWREADNDASELYQQLTEARRQYSKEMERIYK
jgi:hypothetical protein